MTELGKGEEELLLQEKCYIPWYEPERQIRLVDPKNKGSYGDSVLQAIQEARTAALRERQAKTGQPLWFPSEGLLWALENTNPEVGKSFDAHGFGEKVDPVASLEEILTKGIDPKRLLYTTNFMINEEAGAALGADSPKTEGGIILLAECGQRLNEGGVKYVVVGEGFMNVVDLLKERYPQVEIVPWHEAPARLTQIYNEKNGKNLSAVKIDPENRPKYSSIGRNKKLSPSLKNQFRVPILTGLNSGENNLEIW